MKSLQGAEGQGVQEHAQRPRLAALAKDTLHLGGDLRPLLVVGGVHVEEVGLPAHGADLPHDALDIGQGAAPVEVHAEHVEAGAGQREAGGLAEAGRRAEDQGPAGQPDGLDGGRGHLGGHSNTNAAVLPLSAMAKTAGIVLIGNEILSGKIADANAAYLCRELRALGVEVRRISVIPDEVDLIAAEVREQSAAHDVVFTSGGVGPTHDDVTMEGVARAVGSRVIRHPSLVALLEHYYKGRSTRRGCAWPKCRRGPSWWPTAP